MPKIVIEDCKAQVYIDGDLTDVLLTVEIDTERLDDAARRAWRTVDGIATWSDRAFRVFIQEQRE